MAGARQIYSCSGIKLNTTVAKKYGWSHGGVESKDCEQDTPPVDPSLCSCLCPRPVAAAQSDKPRTADACNYRKPRSELED